MAHGLLSLGVSQEIGWRYWLLIAWSIPVVNYAVAKCGAMLVPINFRYKKDELVYVVNNSNPKVLFFGHEFSSMVEEAKESVYFTYSFGCHFRRTFDARTQFEEV